ncbi:PAS domain S-box protein [Roseomonas sp. AR75]|uniref:GAF domain-containing hybrid sensor histidine kinase/response regulator n=1 Tax=Roseomonas sp. AR75 TaxID=2562311 RepID=UPI0010C154CF|nr:PAS domain S-box protein [Roseomonas sp. AR75]
MSAPLSTRLVAPAFLAGGGEMGERIRRHDWAATPLGPLGAWPQPLRVALGICLHSSFPTAIYWGPDLRLLYNDAWAVIPAERHPWALGRPAREVWADIWEVVAPQFARVMDTGEGFSTFDQMLPMQRGGRKEETYWNYSITPIHGADGRVAGIFNQGNETTERVLAERRQTFLLALADRLRALSDPRQVIAATQEALGRHLGANRVGYGEVDATARWLTTDGNWTDGAVSQTPRTRDLAAFGPEILATLRSGSTLVVHDIVTDPRTATPESRAAFARIEAAAAVAATFVQGGRVRAGLFVHSRNARRWSDSDIRLVEAVAERTWAAVERARAETALRESEARFRIMADCAPLMLWVTEPDGSCSYLNRNWYDYTGQTEAEALGYGWLEAVHPEDRARSAECFRAANERSEAFRLEYRLRRHDGAYRWAIDAAAPRFGEHGEFLGYVGSVMDIDERHEAETRLRASEERYRNLAETLEHRVAEAVSERARTEEALRQAQKLEAIGQLTGGVAHDFNNLLTVIRSSADLLRRDDLPEARRRRYLDAIRDTVDRAARVTGQLLAFARRQALRPQVFSAAERVLSVTDMLRSVLGSRVRLAVDAGCGDCLVLADPSQFEAALVNIAVNARDAMDGEGLLSVSVRQVAGMPRIRGHSGGAGDFVAIALADTGCGIPPERISHIFEPFFTTKEVGKGTGLGLSQVYGFAKQSGGDVAVASEVGRGTTFTLYLPRASQEDAVLLQEAEAQDAPESGEGLRVLLVEDNAEVGAFTAQILRDLGFPTVLAANTAEALARLEEPEARFDVVFSDVVMPGRSGIELGEEVRRRYPGVAVVLTSGYSHVLAEEGRHGFELLHKPYAAAELSQVLRRAARNAQRAG